MPEPDAPPGTSDFDLAREALQELSPVSGRFLEVALDETAGEDAELDPNGLPEWVRASTQVQLQPWPTFVGNGMLDELRSGTILMSDLLRSIPRRLFRDDPRRITEFYRLPDPLFASLLLEPPTGIESSLTRCDWVHTAEGFRCLEVNAGAFLGGWQVGFWERIVHSHRAVAHLREELGIRPHYRDPLVALFSHILTDCLEHVAAADDGLCIALAVRPDLPAIERPASFLEQICSAILAERGADLTARVLFCSYPEDLRASRGRLYAGDVRVDAVVEYTEDPTPSAVFRCFKAGNVRLYNGPYSEILGDKRNLALLSRLATSEDFDEEERRFIQNHLPWTREVRDETVTDPDGRLTPLVDLLLHDRVRMVIKPALGSGGSGVAIGRLTDPAEWKTRVRAAADEGGWIAQRYCGSRPYLFPSGPLGPVIHDVVWGTFCFGRSWGGSFLRTAPRDVGGGVINTAHGAVRGLVYEV